MQRQSFLGIPAALVAAITLTFMAGCSEHPTDVGIQSSAEVAFASIGDPGVTDGVPLTPTAPEAHDYVFPSTNETNIANGWSNVTWNADDAGLGEAPLKFEQPRGFLACFEIRIDDQDPNGEPPTTGNTNWNPSIQDGQWELRCLGPTPYLSIPHEETFTAISHVDVRLSVGGERDERFDWTRFYVMSADSKDDCQNGGWQTLGFANQGQCIRFVETGKY